jgi:hypothetical protein
MCEDKCGFMNGDISFSFSFPRSLLITGFVTRVSRYVSHVEEDLPTYPEHPSSSSVFINVLVARSLVFCVILCRSLFVLFSFCHCDVCPSTYGFELLLCHLQTFLPRKKTGRYF